MLAVLVALGTLGALYSASLRYRVERRNRSAEIAVDYAEVNRLAAAVGLSPVAALRRLREAGAGAVAITEDTLQTLIEAGAATPTASGPTTSVQVRDGATLERIGRGWRLRGVRAIEGGGLTDAPSVLLWSSSRAPRTGSEDGIAGYVHFRGSYAALSSLGIGLPPAAANDARASGLRPIARVLNFAGASSVTMAPVLADLRSSGAEVVIFSGTEVFGHYGAHKEAASAFAQTAMLFGQVEFGKQKGDERLASGLKGDYVRVHSISEGEMGTLSEDDAVDRLARAVRERNVRVCYVRLLTFAGNQALETNARYIGRIVRGMGRGGLIEPGRARPFEVPGVPIWALGLCGLGAGALTAWVALSVVPGADRKALWWIVLVPLAFAAAACAGDMGRKLVALAAAVSAPTLACLPMVAMLGAEHAGGADRLNAVWRAVRTLLAASLVTSLGIASVVGLLASLPFMMKTSQFLGIKAAHAIPILLIGVLLVTGLPGAGEEAAQARRRMAGKLRELLARPIAVGAIVLALAMMAGLMLAVARTGNEPGVGVSGVEMRARAFLDAGLPIRPRTKEFLLGHPALVLAIGLAAAGRRRWGAALAVIGVVGQVSVLNTFCHIHTPLVLSAMRVTVGLALGAAIGVAALLIALRWVGRDTGAEAHAEPAS